MISSARRLAGSGWMLAPCTLLVAIVLPALAYALITSVFPGALPLLQYTVATAYVLTALMTLLEARAATGSRDEPNVAAIDDPVALAELPTLTAVVSAYLPNEQELVAETIVHLATELRVAPGSLQIILAYNTPQDIPDVENVLRGLAELNVAFTPLRVASSHSKGENIAAALSLIKGEVTVLLDADHRPQRDAAARALRWFDSGYDIVQGRCVIRDYENNALARLIAVEFEQIYAVSHAGRSLAFDTAMFCGTNGWWRTSVLREIGMEHNMLTEDIDSSVRALLSGRRIIHDRSIVSTELAPPTLKAWWGQRLRWAQGWFQVTLRHQASVIRSPVLKNEVRLYWTYLLGWRELFPLLSLQIFSLLLASVLLGHTFSWFYDPYLVATSVLTVIAGPLLGLYTYRLALPSHRRELRGWFLIFALTSMLYTTAKNTVAIVANVRELTGQRGWVITQRSGQPARRRSRRRAPLVTTGALLLLALGLLAASAGARPVAAPPPRPSPATPVTTERATIPLAPLASTMTLTGRAPISTILVPVPHDWSGAQGVIHLRWQSSPEVAPNSTLLVRIDGALAAATGLGPGRGALDVRVPPHKVTGGVIALELDGQLHSRVDAQCCIPDAATAAIVALDQASSTLVITGTRQSGPPLLADLPGSLVDTVGGQVTPLQVVLPYNPSPAAIRAAALISGAVARADGVTSTPIRLSYEPGRRALDQLPGQVVEILNRGRARASVRRRPDGRLIVSLSGAGDGVVRVAWALAQPHPAFIPGAAATITSGLPDPAPTAPPSLARIAPVSISGTGPSALNAVFRLPESRELTHGKAHLVLDAGFTAPAGGRVDITLNGYPLTSRTLPVQQASQFDFAIDLVASPVDAIDHRVALGLLTPGTNIITLRSDLPAGQPVGGAGDAQPPSLHVLPTSTVSFTSKPRSTPPSLALWPWPFAGATDMTRTTFVLPAAPTLGELTWVLKAIDEAARWTGAPAAPQIAIAPRSLPAGDVVVLGRGASAPVALPRGAPAHQQDGLLMTWSSGGRQLLVADGVRALRPLGHVYFVGKVAGAAAIVGPLGTVRTLVPVANVSSFAAQPLPWKIPAAILVVGVLGMLAVRMRKVRRRIDELPPTPAAVPVDPALADDPFVRRQLAEWETLAAQEVNGDTRAADRS